MAPLQRFPAALLIVLLAASGAPGVTDPSSSNLALRGELKPADRTRYGDVWGYGQYLLLATFVADSASDNGLYVIDASDPDSLRVTGHLQTDAPARDVTAVDTLCLLAFEPGLSSTHPPVLLASLADPTSPRVLGTFRSDSVTQVHNAWLDPPYAYLACSSTGDLRIVDFTDPAAPVEVGSWSSGSNSRYLHDLIVVDTLAYLAYWGDGLRVLSVADPTHPYQVGQYLYPPDARAHSVALSTDRRTCYLADEIFTPPYGHLRVLDLSDLSDIREVASWECPNSDATIHNVFTLGNTLYVSYYLCGVRLLDISNPTDPVEIAYADVDGPRTGLSGFWGVYPAAGATDTLVYASHMDRGAFVFEHRPFHALIVAADGSAPYDAITDALGDAGSGDTVRVLPGVYAESVEMKSRVVLEGAGPDLTVIDPGPGNRGISLRGGGPETVIRRLGVSSGFAADTLGGGGLLVEESAAVVESVTVAACAASASGGGVSVIGGNPTLRALHVRSCRAPSGAGLAFRASAPGAEAGPLLVDCTFEGNAADSAGGGILARGLAPITVIRATCLRDSAPRGAGIAAYETPSFRLLNSVVSRNDAGILGGGLYGEDAAFAIDNSVLADNSAPAGSAMGGTGIYGLFAELRDAVIISNHGASTFSADASSDVQFDACDLSGNEGALVAGVLQPPDTDPARGNRFEDPLLVRPGADPPDYFPAAGSPLIDAGFPSPEENDLDGTRQDIGLGGGPESAWLAPQLAPGLRVDAGSAYEAWLSWGAVPAGGATWHAVYSALPDSVPLDGAHRRGRAPASALYFIDHTPTSSDTAFLYRVVPEDSAGHAGSPSGTLSVRPLNRPPSISHAEPNPFRSRTRFHLLLEQPADVAIDIYDATGRRVRTLLREPLRQGPLTIEWDGRDDGGNELPSGHYFLREKAGEGVVGRHVVLLR